MTPPWWTEADQAELDIAVWELVCVLDGPTDPVRRHEAIQALIDWRYRRSLLSKAEWYRRRHLQAHLAQVKELLPA